MAEDEIPPLEDMTELLNQIQSLQKKTESHWPEGCRKISSHTSTAHSLSQPESISSVHFHSSKQCEQNTRFGGMKKGFLFGQSKPTPKTKNTDVVKEQNGDKCSPEDSIPFLKPRTERKDSDLKFAEVQEAMESGQSVFRNKDWVTEDLLEKVQKNELLSKRLSDPHFMQAITDFQKNPQAAITKYQSNTEVWSLLKEFSGILGQHFMELGEKQDMAGGTTLQSVKTEPLSHALKMKHHLLQGHKKWSSFQRIQMCRRFCLIQSM
ncbi:uncharacterized protein LOC112566709 [Pomacea canaliculata]|uniref:uncharacterized protein LOC112566709 n=1 Tax=Pomacea canaliculata TaxID=400727 RepID=UPI000D73702F|nr:uncharacterized protein LOC112566709 [Pomacea canaliculata]